MSLHSSTDLPRKGEWSDRCCGTGALAERASVWDTVVLVRM